MAKERTVTGMGGDSKSAVSTQQSALSKTKAAADLRGWDSGVRSHVSGVRSQVSVSGRLSPTSAPNSMAQTGGAVEKNRTQDVATRASQANTPLSAFPDAIGSLYDAGLSWPWRDQYAQLRSREGDGDIGQRATAWQRISCLVRMEKAEVSRSRPSNVQEKGAPGIRRSRAFPRRGPSAPPFRPRQEDLRLA